MKKVSKAQARARSKLTVEWQSPYGLQENVATLDSLVRIGLANRVAAVGSMFDPRTGLKYQLR